MLAGHYYRNWNVRRFTRYIPGHAAIRVNVGESQLFQTILCCLHGVSAKAQLRSSFSEGGGEVS